LFGLPADASADDDPNKALPTAIFIINLDKVCLHFAVLGSCSLKSKRICSDLFWQWVPNLLLAEITRAREPY
jgi:hypothetical protein